MLFFPSFYRNNVCQKEKEQNKTLIPCLPLNPARGNKSQSLPEFLDFMLIFFTSDGKFLARATKVISDFPAGSSCPPRPIFTSSAEGTLNSRNDKWHKLIFSRGARDLRISGLMMSFHHRAGLKHIGLYTRYRRCVSEASSRSLTEPGVRK